MGQLVSRLKSVLFTASFVVVGLASPEALADGTVAGNPPRLFVCGSPKAAPRDCLPATAEDLAVIILAPAPPGDDPAVLDPTLWRCTPTTPGRVDRCAPATMADVVLDLMAIPPSLGDEVREILEAMSAE